MSGTEWKVTYDDETFEVFYDLIELLASYCANDDKNIVTIERIVYKND